MNSPLSLFSSEQIRAIDAHAIESLGLTSYERMGRAGAAAWTVLRKRWPKAERIVVVCGPGNNGGDGYVLARIAKAAGYKVQVVIPPDGLPRSEECKRAWTAWREVGGITRTFDGRLPETDVWVDALYGIGLKKSTAGAAQAIIERINASRL